MLYLDASALAKRYVQETGSEAIRRRFMRNEEIFTSALSFAEILAALARKSREGQIRMEEFERAQNQFRREWGLSLKPVGLDDDTLSAVPDVVARFRIRGADAVHLSAALWLRGRFETSPNRTVGESMEFGVADKELAQFAADCGLQVFNPDET